MIPTRKGSFNVWFFPDGTPKGLKNFLIERGIYVRGMSLDDMKKEIAKHSDFCDEQPEIEHFLRRKGHACLFLPKFYCELNPIKKC